ncbi:hypothetical protein SpCBS45565_g02978 [Spizellomyces sp. 'palustris']|nr:hypothetical protein SpCBS45565_g02978 [Spizellomyces sp. 'palustris']
MEVLRNSFEALLHNIQEAVQEADFIAIDTELSGIGTARPYQIAFLDTVQERYEKIRRSAQNFLVIQFGLCTFTWDSGRKVYVAKPFNCYVFPQSGSRTLGLDRQYSLQIGSLEFLRGNKFDFNKWISQGIPFVNHDDEAEVRQKIGVVAQGNDIPIEGANREFTDSTIQAVQSWLQNSSEKTLEVAAPSSFHRRLIHQEIKKRYNSALSTEGTAGYVTIRKLTNEERKLGSNNRVAYFENELEQLIGFRKVIEVISRSKKPVIGHNMMLDLCQTYEKFHRSLPENVQDFKQGLRNLFPVIYDTKYIAHSESDVQPFIMQSALSDVLRRVSLKPFTYPTIAVHPDFTGYEDADNFHEAGYDAYATGVVFVKLMGQIVKNEGDRPLSFDSPAFQPALNKLHIMRSDIPYVNILGDEDIPDRSHVFKVYDFPSDVTLSDVQSEFKTLGSVGINFIDDNSCFLTVRNGDMVKDVIPTFGEEGNANGEARQRMFSYRIETFADHAARQIAQNVNEVGGIGALRAPHSTALRRQQHRDYTTRAAKRPRVDPEGEVAEGPTAGNPSHNYTRSRAEHSLAKEERRKQREERKLKRIQRDKAVEASARLQARQASTGCTIQ